MILLSVPDLRGAEAEYLARCVADNWVSSAGPFVVDFESRMAAVAGREHGVAAVNGTTALQLLLEEFDVSGDGLVVVPDWTFAATANAVIHAGGRPLFVDISQESWTLDPVALAQAFSRYGDRIRAVVAVHTLGHPADMDAIRDVCDASGVPVLEDSAGAIGAQYKSRPAGSLGAAAIFSFNGNKTVTAGGGGMIVTDDAAVAQRVRHASTQARVGSEYLHDAVGHNFRMTNVNAAIGVAQLERLNEMLSTKRLIASRYDAAVQSMDGVVSMPRLPWAESSCWLYSVLLRSEDEAQRLVAEMGVKEIQARTFWRSLSVQTPYSAYESVLRGVSQSLSGRVVSLPCSSSLTDEQQVKVLSALEDWHRK